MIDHRVAKSDNGGRVSLKPGDRLVVVLPENGSTGFEWEVDGPPAALLGFEGKSYGRNQDSFAAGSTGETAFIWKAVGLGEAALRLKLWRPWEGDRSVVETWSSRIVIE